MDHDSLIQLEDSPWPFSAWRIGISGPFGAHDGKGTN